MFYEDQRIRRAAERVTAFLDNIDSNREEIVGVIFGDERVIITRSDLQTLVETANRAPISVQLSEEVATPGT